MAFLGIDLGTGGVRCLLVEDDGSIRAETSRGLKNLNVATVGRGSEQDPREWIEVLEAALDELFADPAHRQVQAIAVDSTSGTVLPVAEDGTPLGMAFLYNDMRAQEEAEQCAAVFGGSCSPTFSLPKILWMRAHMDLADDCLFLHAADYLNSWLAGTIEVPTDFTNAMKTGVDLKTEQWSEAMPALRLPEVIAPGKRFGVLRPELQERWQLPPDIVLVSGATDSNAAFYASGAAAAGDWSTTIGTTLAVKGLSASRLDDPEARIYCHKHPDGTWLPGGASNAGGEIVRERFAGRMEELEAAAAEREESRHLIYPSVRTGERLPFSSSSFAPFLEGDQSDEVGVFLGCLEGVAFVEALVYELLESLGAAVGDTIYATGGAAKSRLGLQVRADLLQKTLCVPSHPNSAMGAAILAAAGFLDRPVGQLSRQLVTIETTVDPRPSSLLQDRLAKFRQRCQLALA
jgi:sugar (pentulose or hexulose) kinase